MTLEHTSSEAVEVCSFAESHFTRESVSVKAQQVELPWYNMEIYDRRRRPTTRGWPEFQKAHLELPDEWDRDDEV